MYYRIDSDGKLWWASDENKWALVSNGTWMDYDGNWYKIVNNMFMKSTDSGKSWTNVPGSTWRGGDGKWYKFDNTWGVWVEK